MFEDCIQKLLACSPERVRVIGDASSLQAPPAGDAVVIWFAAWSGPCHVAFKAYSECLNHLSAGPEIWILDVDTVTARVNSMFNSPAHGWGEVAFFRRGVQQDELLHLERDHAEHFKAKWQAVFGS